MPGLIRRGIIKTIVCHMNQRFCGNDQTGLFLNFPNHSGFQPFPDMDATTRKNILSCMAVTE
jgi:hypothetical protein